MNQKYGDVIPQEYVLLSREVLKKRIRLVSEINLEKAKVNSEDLALQNCGETYFSKIWKIPREEWI